MTLLANSKILRRFILIGLVVMLYDVILHSLLVVIHIAFEWLELGLEEIIEHIFHTTRLQSQIIVFYLLWLIALYVLYRLWRIAPGLYNQAKTQLLAARLEYASLIKHYWGEQSSIQKVKWLASFTLSLYCLSFFAF